MVMEDEDFKSRIALSLSPSCRGSPSSNNGIIHRVVLQRSRLVEPWDSSELGVSFSLHLSIYASRLPNFVTVLRSFLTPP